MSAASYCALLSGVPSMGTSLMGEESRACTRYLIGNKCRVCTRHLTGDKSLARNSSTASA